MGQKSTKVIRLCLFCHKEFREKPSRIKDGRGKYCSKLCCDKAKIGIERPILQRIRVKCHICNYIFETTITDIKRRNPKYCSSKCYGTSQIGIKKHTRKHSRKSKKKMSLTRRNKGVGERNGNWKGGTQSYDSLHNWVEIRLGKPRKCQYCKTTKAKFFDWANKSHQYKHDLNDWLRLCRLCHRRYDAGTLA